MKSITPTHELKLALGPNTQAHLILYGDITPAAVVNLQTILDRLPFTEPAIDFVSATIESFRPVDDLEHVTYLLKAGMVNAVLFRDCDPVTTIAEFNKLRNDGWPIPSIVHLWTTTPPKPKSDTIAE